MIWDEKAEKMPRSELEELQLERLNSLLKRAYERQSFYRKKFDQAGLKPEIKSHKELKNFPFTEKDDLRAHYPFNFFAVPLSEVVRVHASSGTTGQITVVGYTKNDIDLWSELMARTLASCNTMPDDIVQNAYGYGLFTGGLGFHYGAERLGATVIPISGGNTKRQIMIMKDFSTTVLTCTPSYALHLGEAAEELGYDPKSDFRLKSGVFGAEPWSEQMRSEIESKLGLEAFDLYGLSEIIGPGVSTECSYHSGLHLYEDHFLPEIINPETGEVLGPGEVGELVITTLTKEATPLVRYRTRDITSLNYEPCPCGRTLARMERVRGRSDDMLIIRGVNVFPSQIEQILMEAEETAPHYMIIIDRKGALDSLEIWVEVNEDIFSDEVKNLEKVERTLEYEIRSQLGVTTKVKLVEPRSIQRSEGKAKRVFDRREI